MLHVVGDHPKAYRCICRLFHTEICKKEAGDASKVYRRICRIFHT
jgi:hypothetical protein